MNLNHILDNYSYSLSSSINLKFSRKDIKAKIITSIGKWKIVRAQEWVPRAHL